MRLLAAIATILSTVPVAQADPLYRCVDSQQRISYRSDPCPATSQSRTINIDSAPGKNFELGLRRSDNGHFYLMLAINGVPIHGMIDTGASDVALTTSQMQRTNLRPLYPKASLHNTANGTIQTTSFYIPSLSLYGIPFYNISASTMNSSNDEALIGMSLLKHFNISVEGDVMFLRSK